MENYDEYGYDENPQPAKSAKGYQIIIIVLAVILAALSFLYFNQMSTLKKEYAIERDTLQRKIALLVSDYDDLRTENDTIAFNLNIERERADSLLESLTKERTLNRNKIRQYEKELGTLRTVMRNYVHQIDSLNTLNKELVAQNMDMRQQVSSQRQRAEVAEEKAEELTTKIRKGSVIKAREINLVPVSKNDRVVSRAKNADRLRIDFVLSANELGIPGERTIYVRITGPDGYILASNAGAVFDYEGEKRTYSAARDVDYQNFDLPVNIFYNGGGITGGQYSVGIYMDGFLIGETDMLLK